MEGVSERVEGVSHKSPVGGFAEAQREARLAFLVLRLRQQPSPINRQLPGEQFKQIFFENNRGRMAWPLPRCVAGREAG